MGNGEVTEPDATRSFSMTLPLTDGANGETLRVHAQGFAFTQDGATARLTLRGGGRVTVKDIPTGTELDLLQTLELPASPTTTYQLSADIELHQRHGTVGDGYQFSARGLRPSGRSWIVVVGWALLLDVGRRTFSGAPPTLPATEERTTAVWPASNAGPVQGTPEPGQLHRRDR